MKKEIKRQGQSEVLDQYHIFVGYDPREAVAYHVCCNSIIRHSSKPVVIHPIALRNIKEYKEEHNVESGLTKTNPTNQFIFSRFLVPYLMGYGHHGQAALFIDGDMIFRDDPIKLFNEFDSQMAVQVVKHNYKTKSTKKYLNQDNLDYPRKNWSSVILWNCKHARHKKLTPEFISKATGQYLHRFEWVEDDRIGDLPVEWNWLPDEYGVNDNAKLLHWTLGTPCFLDPEYSMANMASEWHREKLLTDYSIQTYQV